MNEIKIAEMVKAVLREVQALAGEGPAEIPAKIPVELSARHVHLSQADVDRLFSGSLTPARELSQPGQFLAKERVRLIGPKGVIDNVAVLGPARESSQVEISLTDARNLGVDAPVRQSGDTLLSPGIVLASGTGITALEEGVIAAGRHIHMPEAYARARNLRDRDLVAVRIGSRRPVVMEDVLVRISPEFELAMHIDLDEGNGCGWEPGCTGELLNPEVEYHA